ncbi:MAG: hypothetical protein O2955_20430 [Planctomycetota bacterium]|nr:hypothetical protein [Planctomycetota bacterium]MDA1214876.1 hypothetical protein [Planctomycetota bacterium]
MNEENTANDQNGSDKPPVEPLNIFFRLLIPSTVLFVFFTLVWMVSLLGDSPSPVARWFVNNGMWPIGVCFVISIVVGVLALGIDNKHNRTSYAQLEEKLKNSDQQP